jgi:hypothetical protein
MDWHGRRGGELLTGKGITGLYKPSIWARKVERYSALSKSLVGGIWVRGTYPALGMG